MGLKRMLRNWLHNDNIRRGCDSPEPVRSSSTNPAPEKDEMLNFRVFQAVGSHVVEFSRYDTFKGNRVCTLYTIPHDGNFGEQIAKIATTEILKQ